MLGKWNAENQKVFQNKGNANLDVKFKILLGKYSLNQKKLIKNE